MHHMAIERRTSLSFFSSLLHIKPFVALVLLIFFLSGSVLTVRASDNAKPGDFLFPFDRAVESVRLILSSGERKTELRVRFAEERVSEIEQIFLTDVRSKNTSKRVFGTIATTTDSGGSNATTTDSGNDIATTTHPGGDNSTTTPKDDTSHDGARMVSNSTLQSLLKTRKKLLEKGNDRAVASLDRAIARLRVLSLEHGIDLVFDDQDSSSNIHENDDSRSTKKNASDSEGVVDTSLRSDVHNSSNSNNSSQKAQDDSGDNDERSASDGSRGEDGGSGKDGEDGKGGVDGKNGEDGKDGDEGGHRSSEGSSRVTTLVCHVVGNAHNGKTLPLLQSVLSSHLSHGDLLGSCDTNQDVVDGEEYRSSSDQQENKEKRKKDSDDS